MTTPAQPFTFPTTGADGFTAFVTTPPVGLGCGVAAGAFAAVAASAAGDAGRASGGLGLAVVGRASA